MLRTTVLAALSAMALATEMSSNNNNMYGNGQNMGNVYGSSSTGMMYGGSTTSMMNNAMSTTSSSMMMKSSTKTSSTNSAIQTNANVASCSNQGLNTGMGDQLVTIVQVSDLNGTSLRYSPDNVVAPPGSIVQFQFHPKNHTITESSFAEPCKPLAANLTSAQRPGQKSGFVPVTPADTDMKVYNLLVNDTKPIWIYCGQPGHCQKGMVMVINQNATETVKILDNYRAAAMQVPLPAGPAGPASPPPPPPGAAPSSVTVSGAGVAPTGTPTSAATGISTPGSSTTVGPGPAAQQASGSASGLPAVFTGMAVPRAIPKYAGLSGLAMAGVAALL